VTYLFVILSVLIGAAVGAAVMLYFIGRGMWQ
jgi:hypothetical protein